MSGVLKNKSSLALAIALAASLILGFGYYALAAPTAVQPQNGGLGTNAVPSYGQIPVGNGNGTYTPTATSSLGISAGVTSVFGRSGAVTAQTGDYTTSQVTEGSNLYFTNARAQAAISATTPITYSSGAVGCQTASGSQAGCLSSADWNTFNSKDGWGWPFTPTSYGVATSTTLGFLNGLLATASSTIGDGTQAGGLTISGGATTTQGLAVGTAGQFVINASGQITKWAGNAASGTIGGLTISNGNSLTFGNSSSNANANTVIQGGANASSSVSIKSTIANGTTDSILFLLGNNGGTEAARFQDNSGTTHFGISSSTPGWPLAVGGTGELAVLGDGNNALTYLGFDPTGTGVSPIGRASVGYDPTGGVLFLQGGTGKGINFNVNNGSTADSGTAATLTSGGLFGIGTTTPSSPLDVFSTNNGSAIPHLLLEGTNNNVSLSLRNWGTGGLAWLLSSTNNGNGSGGGKLLISSSGTGNVGAFTSTGNFGIGTTTAYSRLTVAGSDTSGSTRAFEVVNTASSTVFSVSDNGDVAVGTSTTSTGQLTYNGVAQTPYAGIPLWGDGVDGNVTISSGTTTLSRDMMYNNLTLSGTGALRTNGSIVYVAGTLDITNAKVCAINNLTNSAGNSASGATGGAASGGGFPSTGQHLAIAGGNIGLAGANGTVTTGGSAANAGFNQGANTYTLLGGLSGAGGNGGASTNAGGTGGVPSVPGNGFIGSNAAFPNPLAFVGTPVGSNSGNNSMSFFATMLTNTPGGGAGGGDGTNPGGGGGGGGSTPGAVIIIARYINRGASTPVGVICDRGQHGGNGANGTGGNAAGGGAGPGGGGGFAYVAAEQLLGSTATNAIDVSGGDGGFGGLGVGTGSNGNGGWGGNGGGYELRIFNPATFTIGTPNVATSTSPSGTSPGLGATVQVNL